MFGKKSQLPASHGPRIVQQETVGHRSDEPHVVLASDETKKKLQSKLSEIDIQNLEKEAEQKASEIGLPYVDLRKVPITQDALTVMTEEQSNALRAVVFLALENSLRIATTNPNNPQLVQKLHELEETRHADVRIYYVSEQSLDAALEKFARLPKISDSVIGGVEITEKELKEWQEKFVTFEDFNKLVKDANVTDIVTMIISAAFKALASDIHIEAEERDVKVRLRVDGVLHNIAQLSTDVWPKLVARVKLLARLKLNVTSHPQDGRFTIFENNNKTEVRVSTVPTTYGESVVMRILRSGVETFDFKNLGLKGKAYNDIISQLKKPNGMIVSTGPTGSGKTTTLYALMNMVNNEETKIITLEDPVEYKIKGINQSQVNAANNFSFAEGLRSILRQDPDVIMVGEIRDLETAEVAINAALTGHLMLSTMHTNSAAGALPRLLAMGVKPYLMAPAINAIEAQRLVRKLCDQCKKPVELDNATMTTVLNELGKIQAESGQRPDLKNMQFYGAVGCTACNGLGYRGRIGLFEVLTMSPEIEKLILAGNVSEYEVEQIAIKNGMITMLQDGFLKALDGISSVEEVLKRTE